MAVERFRRPFTDAERRQLRSLLGSRTSRTGGLLDAFFAFGGSLLVCLLVLALFRSHSRPLELVASAVSLAIGAAVYVRSRRSGRADGLSANLLSDLQAGEAEVTRFQIVDAMAVDEFEDEGLSFYLRLADGRVLFLSGQYLYEPVEERSFPSTRVEMVRAPRARIMLDHAPLGEYLPPSTRRPAFTREEYRHEVVPDDGAILDVDFESLRQHK